MNHSGIQKHFPSSRVVATYLRNTGITPAATASVFSVTNQHASATLTPGEGVYGVDGTVTAPGPAPLPSETRAPATAGNLMPVLAPYILPFDLHVHVIEWLRDLNTLTNARNTALAASAWDTAYVLELELDAVKSNLRDAFECDNFYIRPPEA